MDRIGAIKNQTMDARASASERVVLRLESGVVGSPELAAVVEARAVQAALMLLPDYRDAARARKRMLPR